MSGVPRAVFCVPVFRAPLSLFQVAADELDEFVARPRIFQERAREVGGRRHGVLLLHAAHRHAEVLRLYDDRHAERVQHFLYALLDLGRQALLHLQPAREHVHDTWNLAQPHDFAVRDIGHVRLAKNGTMWCSQSE